MKCYWCFHKSTPSRNPILFLEENLLFNFWSRLHTVINQIDRLDWDESEELGDIWRKDWSTYFTTTRQVIYARISGRERGYKYGGLSYAAQDAIDITK